MKGGLQALERGLSKGASKPSALKLPLREGSRILPEGKDDHDADDRKQRLSRRASSGD